MKENSVTKILNHFASKTILAILAIIGTAITVYGFFQEKNVEIRYEIIANANVLDLNEDLSKLEVIYDSTNLKQTKENLRIVTVKIINNGEENLLKEFYDSNDPVGIGVNSGTIIETPEIIQASNDYLERNIRFRNFNGKQISFSEVIIEPGEFFILKLLILHKKTTIPEITSFGKIAGQKRIAVVNSVDVREEQGFFTKVYSGDIWTQALRIISYFFIAVIIVLIVGIIAAAIDSRREKRLKNKHIKGFKNQKEYRYTRMDDAIFDRYQENGYYTIKKMDNLLKSEEKLNEKYSKISEQLKSKEFRRFREIKDEKLKNFYNSDNWSVLNDMIKDGVLMKENGSLVINQAMKDTIEKFNSYLVENGENKRAKVKIKNTMNIEWKDDLDWEEEFKEEQ